MLVLTRASIDQALHLHARADVASIDQAPHLRTHADAASIDQALHLNARADAGEYRSGSTPSCSC